MTVRPTDWHPLSDRDLLPGDPELVRWLATHFGQVSTEVRVAAANVDAACAAPSNSTEALLTLRDQAGAMSSDLRHAAARYQHAADALARFAITVDSYQNIGFGMWQKAVAVRDDQQGIERAMILAAAQTDSNDDAAQEAAEGQYDTLQTRHVELTKQLRDLRYRYEQVASDYKTASEGIADDISAVLADNPLADNWYQVYAEGAVDATGEWASTAGAVVGVIGLGLAATGVGAPVGLALIGTGLAVTVLITKSVDYKWGTGTTKGDVANAALDVGLGGLGHYTAWATKGSAASMHWAMTSRKTSGTMRMRTVDGSGAFAMNTGKRADWRRFHDQLGGRTSRFLSPTNQADHFGIRHNVRSNGFDIPGAVDNDSVIRAGMRRHGHLKQHDSLVGGVQDTRTVLEARDHAERWLTDPEETLKRHGIKATPAT